jgi:hypothetical protein
MNHALRIALALLALLAASAADQEFKLPPETTKLRPGPGVEMATASCLLCHSADYISTQPPMDRAAWQAAVQKMREKYGAPIATNTVPQLVDYLAKNYGGKNEETKNR